MCRGRGDTFAAAAYFLSHCIRKAAVPFTFWKACNRKDSERGFTAAE